LKEVVSFALNTGYRINTANNSIELSQDESPFWRKSVQGLHAAGGALRKALVGADLPGGAIISQQFRALVIYQVARWRCLLLLMQNRKKAWEINDKGTVRC
jgi:hypothetical protein